MTKHTTKHNLTKPERIARHIRARGKPKRGLSGQVLTEQESRAERRLAQNEGQS